MGNMLDLSLHEYAETGDIDQMRAYIQRGGDVNKRDMFSNTALHRACCMGYTPIVKLLLKEGALVNARAKDGWTPLHLACRWGRVDIVRILVEEAGADCSITTGDGRSPGEILKLDIPLRQRTELVLLLNTLPNGLSDDEEDEEEEEGGEGGGGSEGSEGSDEEENEDGSLGATGGAEGLIATAVGHTAPAAGAVAAVLEPHGVGIQADLRGDRLGVAKPSSSKF